MEDEMSPEMMEAMQDLQEDQAEDSQEASMELSDEMKEAYGYPEAEEKMNQHSFLHKAAFDNRNTLKTTFLDAQECGRPDFPVRFLLSVKTISEQMLDDITSELKIPNMISAYFEEKVLNVTNSGMSKDGFAMNLNVTKAINTTKRKMRVDNIENLKGGRR